MESSQGSLRIYASLVVKELNSGTQFTSPTMQLD